MKIKVVHPNHCPKCGEEIVGACPAHGTPAPIIEWPASSSRPRTVKQWKALLAKEKK